MPRIPEFLLNSVVFLYQTTEQAEENAKIGGTGFIVTRRAPTASATFGDNRHIPYLISNRHVVYSSGACVARFNRRDGSGKIIDYDQTHWIAHPNGDDLAGAPLFGLLDGEDATSHAGEQQFISQETIAELDVGIGDDVFMMGRFLNHQGRENAIQPAVRFGNISMMPSPLYNKAIGKDQLSYAVEMRSRTGFSGSPVVMYRNVGTSLKTLPAGKEHGWGLLGINWGYIFDEDGENTWLNGVIPAWKISELLRTSALQENFERADKASIEIAKLEANRGGAMPSVAVSEVPAETPSSTAAETGDPHHKERFTALLDAATKTKPPAE